MTTQNVLQIKLEKENDIFDDGMISNQTEVKMELELEKKTFGGRKDPTTKNEMKVNYENEKEDFGGRKDPTTFLPDEPMSYEIKPKKKRKKKKEDPFKDIESAIPIEKEDVKLDPEVTIKVEKIEVELDFNDFADNNGLMVEGANSDDSQEPAVKIEEGEAVLLTFESIVNNNPNDKKTEDICIQSTTTHMCEICHLVFKSKDTLKQHQKRKHKAFRKSFKHVCSHCNMAYEQKSSLTTHIRRKHGPGAVVDDYQEITCDICFLVFKGNSRLRMHMQRKHGLFKDSFKHACPDCNLTYDKHQSLMVHIQRKHKKSKKPTVQQWFHCPFCPKVFTTRESHARHIHRKHQISDEPKEKDDVSEKIESSINTDTGEVTCPECPLVFTSVNSLKLHMRRKHNALREDFKFKCKICNLSYNKKDSLKSHIRRKHEQGSYCDVCNKQFDTREAFVKHSHVKRINECTICGLIFSSRGGLGKHMRCTHKLDSPKVVFCNICNQGFHDKRLLKPHILKVHIKASYTCAFCKKVFKAKESYKRHLLTQHINKKILTTVTQQCDKCTETFDDEFQLCEHINLVHRIKSEDKTLDNVKREDDDIKDLYQCTKCPDVYSTWEDLKGHFEENHQVQVKSQCQVCGEVMPVNDLQKHLKTSHKHTPIIETCKYCNFQTNSKLSMTQHLLRHANATTLHCDYNGCKFKSYYEGAMQKHKRKHVEQGVKLQCSQCPFQTMNKYILRYHEEAHVTGKKRYTCDQCDYATILPANLVQHKYKHSTEKRFKCEVCPFATKYNTSLRFHIKKKHCDLPLPSSSKLS